MVVVGILLGGIPILFWEEALFLGGDLLFYNLLVFFVWLSFSLFCHGRLMTHSKFVKEGMMFLHRCVLGCSVVGGVLLLKSNRLNGRFMVSTRHGNRRVVTYSSCTKTPTVRITSRYRMFSVLGNRRLRHVMGGRQPSVVIPRVRTVHARHLCSFRGRKVRMIPDTHTIGCAVGQGTVHSLTTGRLKLGATGCCCTGSLRRLGRTTRGVNFPYIIGPLVSSSNGKRSLIGDTTRLRRT